MTGERGNGDASISCVYSRARRGRRLERPVLASAVACGRVWGMSWGCCGRQRAIARACARSARPPRPEQV